jgi:hypothetical protein
MKGSELFSLELKDGIHGVVIAVSTAIVTGITQLVSSGIVPTTYAQLKPTLIAGAAAGLMYISKKYFSNSNNEIAKAEPNPNAYKS